MTLFWIYLFVFNLLTAYFEKEQRFFLFLIIVNTKH